MENIIKCQNCGEIIHRPEGARGPVPKYCSKINCNAQHRGHEISKVTILRYSWSKFGGINASSTDKVHYDWYCQSCREQFPEQMSPMKFPIDLFGKEYVNVCGKCYVAGMEKHFKVFSDLIGYIRDSQNNLY